MDVSAVPSAFKEPRLGQSLILISLLASPWLVQQGAINAASLSILKRSTRPNNIATPGLLSRFVLTLARENEVDRSIHQSRADRECFVCDRGVEPRSRCRKHFPKIAAVAGESRRANGISDHVHRVRAAVLAYFHDSVGIVDCDPPRVRTAVGRQRADRVALKRREHYAYLHSAGWYCNHLYGDLCLAQRAGCPCCAGKIAQHHF